MSKIEKRTTEDGKTLFISSDGREYKTRSGAWKRNQKLNPSEGDGDRAPSPSPPESEEAPIPPSVPSEPGASSDTHSWETFSLGDGGEHTDSIPAPLKMLTSPSHHPGRKMSKKELEAMHDTEIALLKAGLGGVDVLLTQYGKGVTVNPDFEVRHSEASKDMVAEAQYAYLDERDIHLTRYMSKGIVAGTLTAWYVGAPLMRIKKEAKKPMLKRIGGGAGSLLSRLPLIGRIFKKKKKPEPNNEFEGNIIIRQEDELDE